MRPYDPFDEATPDYRWLVRQFVVLVFAAALTYAFVYSRAQWSEMHRYNRAFGDASVVVVAIAMAIGPMARLIPRLRPMLPWRREFGIYGVLLAGVHTLIVLGGWVKWDLWQLLGYVFHPQLSKYVMLKHGFGLSNLIGFAALFYGLALALSSNNRSQRLLGGSTWKFLQQSSYVLWALVVVHTGYFLYMHFQDFHRATPPPNWLQVYFAILVGVVASLQMAAFLLTWLTRRRNRKNRPPRIGSRSSRHEHLLDGEPELLQRPARRLR